MAKKLSGAQLRRIFIDYFKKQGHTEVPSSALIPDNDPTLLFSNAGMNQFKDCFLGSQKRPYTRAVTSQKCLRISGKHNDLENVGMTARHHTFFEMLGNFSFGDYFKADAIKFAWELITEELKIPKNKLWVTIFEKDDEAEKLWSELTDVLPGRILRLGEKDNFWAMGETGPCGPCSEIHYYMGDDDANQSEEAFKRDDGSYLEIWNLVFMQFNRGADGALVPLPKPSVDTGMGLERIASVLQGVKSNYDTDLLRDIIDECEKLSGFKYDGSSFEIRDLKTDKNYARDVAMRVIADHSRAISFLIADGVTPSSDGRGYVLRRLIRRAARHGRVLEFKDAFLNKTCKRVISMMSKDYPELKERQDIILRVAEAEEKKFYETLDAGLAILNKECQKLKAGDLFSGEMAFLLHDTYGFPLDLTADVLKAYNLEIDIASFEKQMQEQKTRSREDRKANAAAFLSIKIDSPKTEFLGYEKDESESKIVKIVATDGTVKDTFKEGDEALLIFDSTPFYAESGGQVGDTGIITVEGALLNVLDTQKIQDGHFVHSVKVKKGELSQKQLNKKAHLKIDSDRRSKIRANHTATHLVHAALRNILGDHVKQAGSRVDDNTLRFDYSHFSAPSEDEMLAVQTFVNNEIRKDHETITRIMTIDEARKTGAMALFGEKYGDKVRVVQVGPKSLELCGGTHAERSGNIGFIIVAAENGVSSGVRRIECFAGISAHNALQNELKQRNKIIELLKGDGTDLDERVERNIARIKSLEKELEVYKSKLASASSSDLANNTRTSPSGVKIIVEKVDTTDSETLKNLVDTLRTKLGSGVVALGSNFEDQGIIVAGATSDLSKKIHVGNILKEAVKTSGGRGGGRADFAQAGGVNPSHLIEALDNFVKLVA
jgi:alanyl-tRNA synthetase